MGDPIWEIVGKVLTAIVSAITGLTPIIVKAINETRRKNGCNTCMLGKPLKPKRRKVTNAKPKN